MRYLIALLLLSVACGAPEIPEPSAPPCWSSVEAPYPLALHYDGATGQTIRTSSVPVDGHRPFTARARLTNAAGNGQWNRTQLRAAVWTCDGRNIGAFTFFDVPATDSPGVPLDESATLELADIAPGFSEATALVLVVTPLYATGAHDVELESFRLEQ